MPHNDECLWRSIHSFGRCAGLIRPIVYGCLEGHLGELTLCGVHADYFFNKFCENQWACAEGHKIVEFIKHDWTTASNYD